MTVENLAEMLQETGIPFAYDHFAEGESPDPPFLCFLLPTSDHFAADGKVYFRINQVRIELYIDKKDPAVEKQVEDVLERHGIVYSRNECWIPEERLYEVAYSFEVPEAEEI